MKRNILVLATMLVVFVAAYALLAVRPVQKVRAEPSPCSISTLNGTLGLWGPGDKRANGWALSMLATFDGSGTFTGNHVYGVRNGTTVPGSDGSFSSGTYTVNADCSFTATTNDLEVFGNHELILNGAAVRAGHEVVGTWYSRDGQSGSFHAESIGSY